MVETPGGKLIYFGDNSMQKKTKKNPEPVAVRHFRDDTQEQSYKDRDYYPGDDSQK